MQLYCIRSYISTTVPAVKTVGRLFLSWKTNRLRTTSELEVAAGSELCVVAIFTSVSLQRETLRSLLLRETSCTGGGGSPLSPAQPIAFSSAHVARLGHAAINQSSKFIWSTTHREVDVQSNVQSSKFIACNQVVVCTYFTTKVHIKQHTHTHSWERRMFCSISASRLNPWSLATCPEKATHFSMTGEHDSAHEHCPSCHMCMSSDQGPLKHSILIVPSVTCQWGFVI